MSGQIPTKSESAFIAKVSETANGDAAELAKKMRFSKYVSQNDVEKLQKLVGYGPDSLTEAERRQYMGSNDPRDDEDMIWE